MELQSVKVVPLITPDETTAAQASAGSLDRAGYEEMIIVVNVKQTTTTSGTTVLSVGDSDDNTTFVTICADKTVTAGTNAGCVVYAIDLRGKGRYIQVTSTQNTTTNTTGAVSAVAILGRVGIQPRSTSDMVGGTVGVTPLPAEVAIVE